MVPKKRHLLDILHETEASGEIDVSKKSEKNAVKVGLRPFFQLFILSLLVFFVFWFVSSWVSSSSESAGEPMSYSILVRTFSGEDVETARKFGRALEDGGYNVRLAQRTSTSNGVSFELYVGEDTRESALSSLLTQLQSTSVDIGEGPVPLKDAKIVSL